MSQRATSGGQVFRSDGTVFHMGDWLSLQERYSILARTTRGPDGGASEFSARFTVPGESTYNIGFYPSEGRAVVLWFRDLVLPEGAYILQTVTAEWDTESGTPLVIGELDDRCTCPVLADVRHGVTITGAETLRRDVAFDAGSTAGPARPPSAVNADDAFRIMTKPTVLKINKTDAGAANCSVLYLLWEFAE